MARSHRLVLLALAVALVGCPKKLDPDPLATGLALDRWHTQQLHCRQGDCEDFYELEVPDRGDLSVVMVAAARTASARPFQVALQSGAGQTLTEARNAGAGNTSIRWPVEAGRYRLALRSTDEEREPLLYELQARFLPEPPPPPPPEPQFETLTSEVLEVEGRPGAPEAVLIDRGEKGGLRAGLIGRLVEGGRTIAPIEIEQTFPEGSRARITGALEAPITPSTLAEIDVPADGPGSAEAGEEPLGDGEHGDALPEP